MGRTISPPTSVFPAFPFASVGSGLPLVPSAVALAWDAAEAGAPTESRGGPTGGAECLAWDATEAGAPTGVAPIRVAMISAQTAGVSSVNNEMAVNLLRFE